MDQIECHQGISPPVHLRGVIPEYRHERWRVPAANETEPRPRSGEFAIFTSFLDQGFALPTSDFLCQLLAFYSLKISDLDPHSVQQIALFVVLCECYLGCPPYFPQWVTIFHGRATRVSKSDQSLIPNDEITFQAKFGETFIDMAPSKKAQTQWRKFWFYATEQARPGEEEVVKTMHASIQALKDAGLTAANMYNCWLARRLIPLRSRGHYMWEYRGKNDCTRSTTVEWNEDEYRKALAKITTATFTSLYVGLQPFSEDKPAPKKWQKIANYLPPLAGKEPPEMIEGEEVDDDGNEDEGDRTESDSEARDFVKLPYVSKRGATSSSQSPPEEAAWEEEDEEETTSPPEGKGPAKETVETRPKRLRQTVLEGATELQRPLQAAFDAGARVGPGVKALPTMKGFLQSQEEGLEEDRLSARGGGHEGGRAKKAAEAMKAAADPADMASTCG
ncbi:hypothetical protein QYE76_017281 [Lolium multiflorum]|uniref:Transposase (putative) gypsy type domain-containing protein n=1 Tax=Lolium multiflorum TaxID=4521 RepID=A0AAD8VCA8_LOLMU|nr:hypothetical protein QYE76_017281 [Lolium multiflorum]